MSCLRLQSAGIAEVHQCAQLSFSSFLETQADLCLSFLSTAIIGVGYYAYDRERLGLTIQSMLVSQSLSFCLHLQNVAISGVSHIW